MPTRVIGIYGMGLTQHRRASRPCRCWSTCCCCAAISASPAPASARCAATPTCRASARSASPKSPSSCRSTSWTSNYGFEPPREKGLNTVEACEGILDGEVRAFVGLGGNFVRAVPGPRPHGAGLAQAAADRADRDQAQPQPSDPRRGRLSAALPRPHRDRPAGERPAGGVDGGQHRAASMARAAC